MSSKKLSLFLIFLTTLAFVLRIYNLGLNNLKEEEHTSVKAAAYLYSCYQNPDNCFKSTNPSDNSLGNKLLVLLTNNETKPNLVTQIYLWDFTRKTPTKIHYARAWPHLFAVAATYKALGISEFSSRLIPVIAGTLLIPVSFFFAKYFTGLLGLSLVYSSIITISSFFINYSRHARMHAVFILIFQLAVYFIYKSLKQQKNRLTNLLLALTFLITAYFLQLLTLLLPLAILIYSFYFGFFKNNPNLKTVFRILLLALVGLVYINFKFNINFFQTQFIALQTLPHWQYFNFLFKYPFSTTIVGLGLILISLPQLLKNPKTAYLMTIILTNLIFLIFFSKMPSASSYAIHLLPISLLLILFSLNYWLIKRLRLKPIIFSLVVLLVFLRWVINVPYLYLGKDDRAKLSSAYRLITNLYQPEDQVIGIKVRDYYLQELSHQASIINLPEKQSLTQKEFKQILDQAPGTFITFEKEKAVHLKPEITNYLQENSKKLAGEGLDNYQVEIYYLGK